MSYVMVTTNGQPATVHTGVCLFNARFLAHDRRSTFTECNLRNKWRKSYHLWFQGHIFEVECFRI